MRHAVIAVWPPTSPSLVVACDLETRKVRAGPAALERYDVIAGFRVKAALGGLGVDTRGKRLVELGARRRGVTTERLLFEACGIRLERGWDIARVMQGEISDLKARIHEGLAVRAQAFAELYATGRWAGLLQCAGEWIVVRWLQPEECTLRLC